jgi:hypothetical protein
VGKLGVSPAEKRRMAGLPLYTKVCENAGLAATLAFKVQPEQRRHDPTIFNPSA